jgi:hypothetical protein
MLAWLIGMTATMLEMASVNHVRGVLLEEAILMLLRASGYRIVTTAAADPTLSEGPAGLNVKGRGGEQQIDGIADLRIGQPFSNPQHLLVEAKDYSNEGFTDARPGVAVEDTTQPLALSKCWLKRWQKIFRLQPQVARRHARETERFAGFETVASAISL